MKLWLDDVREPWAHGCLGWVWVRTVEEAIAALQTGDVTQASFDHDLTPKATLGDWENEPTGYDVLLWMKANRVWPKDGVAVHSDNPAGSKRMRDLLLSR